MAWPDNLKLSYSSIIFALSAMILFGLVVLLVTLKNKRRDTWLLIVICFAGFSFSIIYTYICARTTPYSTIWIILLNIFSIIGLLFILLFSYNYPENGNPRESKFIFLGFFLAYGLAMIKPITYFLNTEIYYDFQAHMFMPQFTTKESLPYSMISLLVLIWTVVVLVRKIITPTKKAEIADGPPVSGKWKGLPIRLKMFLFSTDSVEASVARTVSLTALCLVLSFSAYLLFLSGIMDLHTYLAMLSSGLVFGSLLLVVNHIHNISQATTYLTRLVGISALSIFLIFALVTGYEFEYGERMFLNLKYTGELSRIRNAVQQRDFSNVSQSLAYVARASRHTANSTEYQGIYSRDGNFDFSALTEPGVPVSGSDERLLPIKKYRVLNQHDPNSFYIRYIFPLNGALYEVGYPYREYRQLLHEIGLKTMRNLLVAAGALLLLLPPFYYLSILRPLRHLSQGVMRVNAGDYSVRVAVQTSDEIGFLARAFNEMVASVRKARRRTIRLLESNERRRMLLLQKEMNPHFLFNTLDTIHYLLRTDRDRAADALIMLSDNYRFLLEKAAVALVPFEQEWRFVKNYLAIEKIMMGDALNIELENGAETAAIRIPPLTLQPVVENALKHGLRLKRRDGLIRIVAGVSDDILYVTVTDNGRGLDGKNIYGGTLGNLQKRLRYYYAEAQLTIKDQHEGGVRAELLIPLGSFKSG